MVKSAPMPLGISSLTRADARFAFAFALRLFGRDRTLVRRIHNEALVVVLNLHRVSPDASPFWPPLRPEAFDQLVRFLRANFPVVTLAQLAQLDRKSGAVVLSFDDGYRDFVEHACPILAAHGVRANMNVIPECVRTGQAIWNVALYDALQAAPFSLIRELRVPGFTRRLEGNGEDEKARFAARLSLHLKDRARGERESLLAEVARWKDRVEVTTPTRVMDANDVREAARVHEIGAHSFSHESMAHETDAFFADDVSRCRTFFRDELELPLSIYAFPNGSYRRAQVDYLLGNGFDHVLLVDEKMGRSTAKVLPRISVFAPTVPELVMQALGQQARGVA